MTFTIAGDEVEDSGQLFTPADLSTVGSSTTCPLLVHDVSMAGPK